tara:strand:- start:44 stop:478 length:435 start_codon:yes stop_codon:yes gene_type:complete
MEHIEHNVISDYDYDGDTSSSSEIDSDSESEIEDKLIEFKEYILLQALSFKTTLCLEFIERSKYLYSTEFEKIKEKEILKNDIINRISIYKRILDGIYHDNPNFKPNIDIIRLSYCKEIFGKDEMPSRGFPYLGYSCNCIKCSV